MTIFFFHNSAFRSIIFFFPFLRSNFDLCSLISIVSLFLLLLFLVFFFISRSPRLRFAEILESKYKSSIIKVIKLGKGAKRWEWPFPTFLRNGRSAFTHTHMPAHSRIFLLLFFLLLLQFTKLPSVVFRALASFTPTLRAFYQHFFTLLKESYNFDERKEKKNNDRRNTWITSGKKKNKRKKNKQAHFETEIIWLRNKVLPQLALLPKIERHAFFRPHICVGFVFLSFCFVYNCVRARALICQKFVKENLRRT